MKHLKTFIQINEKKTLSSEKITSFKKGDNKLEDFIEKNKGKKIQAFWYIYGLRSAAPTSKIFSLSNKVDCKEIIGLNKKCSIGLKLVSDDTKRGNTDDFSPSHFKGI